MKRYNDLHPKKRVKKPKPQLVYVHDIEGMKMCPQCGQITEKIGGCNFIRCRCGGNWCWICRQLKGGAGCENKEHNSH